MAIFPISTYVSRVSGPPQGQWTYADWEALPDDGNRYEVIDGVLYMSTAPSYYHQWLIKRFYRLLGIPAEDRKLAECGFAPIGVLMPGAAPVQPDFVLILTGHLSIIKDRRIHGVPDLIAEVLSPGSKDYDEDVKLQAYARAGLPEYVVLDPAERQLRLYRLSKPGEYAQVQKYNPGDSVTFACLPDIVVPISELFEGAPDTTL
jgi:Uma2 family endonuclease